MKECLVILEKPYLSSQEGSGRLQLTPAFSFPSQVAAVVVPRLRCRAGRQGRASGGERRRQRGGLSTQDRATAGCKDRAMGGCKDRAIAGCKDRAMAGCERLRPPRAAQQRHGLPNRPRSGQRQGPAPAALASGRGAVGAWGPPRARPRAPRPGLLGRAELSPSCADRTRGVKCHSKSVPGAD